MATSSDRNDPYSSFNFIVEIEGLSVAGFSECSGLTMESDVIEYRNGDEPTRLRKLPGIRKYTNIVLKRGYTQDEVLWKWRKEIINGKTRENRKPGAIVLMDETQQPVLRWNFEEGWPSKWEGPSLNAKNSEVAIESLEITVEQVVMEVAG